MKTTFPAPVRWAVLLLALLGLAACGGRGKPPAAAATQSATATADGRIRHTLDDPEVAQLWREAEALREAGVYEEAGTLLERALTLSPEDPVLWSRIAEIELRTGKLVQAENYAVKSNLLAGNNQQLNYRNWLIVMHAREERGDQLGAAEARSQAERFRP